MELELVTDTQRDLSLVKTCLTLFFFFVLLAFCSAISCREPDLFCDQAKAFEDLQFFKQTLLENHPGTNNTEDPHFIKLVMNGFETALNQVESIQSESALITLLQTYAKNFDDEHLKIAPTFIRKSPEQKNQGVFLAEEDSQDTVWISLPSFSPAEEQKKQLEKIIETMPSFRSKKKIIFDLRGNTGGNSEWGNKILSALFSKEYAIERWQESQLNVYVEWLISDGNITHVKSLAESLRQDFGENNPTYQAASKVYIGMLDARTRGDRYYREETPKIEKIIRGAQNPVNAQIYLIIDRKCASACLNFIDDLNALKHQTILIGEPTGKDTFYLEVRSVKLPSGLAELQFPIKVYRNRLRGHNERYLPHVRYGGDLGDTTHFKKWLQRSF